MQTVVAIAIFRDNLLHLCANRGSAIDGHDGSELAQLARQIVPAMRCATNLPNLRERRRMNFFCRVRKFFEKLLAVAQASKANAYFALGLSERRTNVFARSRMRTGSPISRSNVSPWFPIAKPCRTNETASRCGHEESHDVWVRDRELLVISNLFLKIRERHSPFETQHIPKRTETQRMRLAGRQEIISSPSL